MGSNETRRFELKVDVNKLTRWQWAGLILIARIFSAGLAIGTNTFTLNVTLEERLQLLEDQVNIPVNSTISAMIKEASYIVSVHDVGGTAYYCLINGTDDRAGRLEYYNVNKTLVQQFAIGNLTSVGGTIFLKQVLLNSSLTYGANVLIFEDYQGHIHIYRDNTCLGEIGAEPPIGYIPNPVNGTTYTCRGHAKDVYISGGTVTTVELNGIVVFETSNVMVHLEPAWTIRVVWTVAPSFRVFGVGG